MTVFFAASERDTRHRFNMVEKNEMQSILVIFYALGVGLDWFTEMSLTKALAFTPSIIRGNLTLKFLGLDVLDLGYA